MAKKRVFSDVKSVENKKRSRASGMTTPIANQNQERNVLNDGLLSLYKKELGKKEEKSSTIEDQSFSDNKQKEVDLSSSKTPSKTGKRSKNAVFIPQQSDVTFSDVGGLDNLLKQVLKMFLHYKAPALFQKLGIPPVRGILLHGPPGCGKTHIAHAIAGELEIPILEVVSTELVCGISGESESKIRDAFDAAVATGRCILFIDEIDAVCSKRETTDNPMHRRMVVQMIKCLDELYKKDPDGNVIVIGATNMPDAIDPSLRRGKRFDTELAVGIPNEDARIKILQVLCKKIPLSQNFDVQWLAHNTPGYVGADLYTLVCNATKSAFDRIYGQLVKSTTTESKDCTTLSGDDNSIEEQSLDDARAWFKSVSISDEEVVNFCVTEEDFQVALPHCIPNSKREGFASVPDTSWDNIGALEHVKKELRKQIMWPVQDRKFYERNKLSSSHGILLYGPKGCGKTLLAKAIANECGINFISVHGPELLNMYVGESEKAVRRCFERARNSAPCVIFFDEFDALCPPRSSSKENVPTERVVNQLLTETCGIRDRNQVFLIAATNRLEKIDSAMLRPGRLGKIIYVGLPTPEGRVEILKSISKDKKFEDGLNLETIAFDERCNNFSGADLVSLLNAAAEEVVEEMKELSVTLGNRDLVICWRHFDKVLNVTKPSNSEQDRKYFEKSRSQHSRT